MIARRILLLTGLLTLAFASPHAIALPPAPGERIVAGVTAAGVDSRYHPLPASASSPV